MREATHRAALFRCRTPAHAAASRNHCGRSHSGILETTSPAARARQRAAQYPDCRPAHRSNSAALLKLNSERTSGMFDLTAADKSAPDMAAEARIMFNRRRRWVSAPLKRGSVDNTAFCAGSWLSDSISMRIPYVLIVSRLAALHLRESHGRVQHRYTQQSHERGQGSWKGTMTLRNQIARSYVEEEAGKERENDSQDVPLDPKEKRGEDARARRDRIGQQPLQRPATIAVVAQHDVHRVDAVRKVVGQNGDRDHRPHRDGCLECQNNGDAVQEAVQ